MVVRIEKDGPVWTVIHDRPEARNAMDPESADALTAAFLEFDADDTTSVAVLYAAGGAFCAGWDLKFISMLDPDYPLGELDISPAKTRGNGGEIPRGPLGPSRLELDKPVITAVAGQGVLHHATDMEVDKNYVDSHGQDEAAFAFCHLPGFQLLPRLKGIDRQRLYRPEAGAPHAYPNLDLVLSRPIDQELIPKYCDEIVKYTTALRLGTADAEAILSRFTRSGLKHPAFQALLELGKIRKTIFLCRQLHSEALRQEIDEGLNVIENWNSANDFIWHGKGGEISTNNKEEQEITVLALHLLQICLVYIKGLSLSVRGHNMQQRLVDQQDRTNHESKPLRRSTMTDFPRCLLEFQQRFPDEAACVAYLMEARQPNGFVCPACGGIRGWALQTKAWTHECAECDKQTSVTAGTIMHGSKLPMTVWFWAAYLMATHSNGISALQIQKQLGLGSYKTAWLLCAKLRRAMVAPNRAPLAGLVEVDEAELSCRAKNNPGSPVVAGAAIRARSCSPAPSRCRAKAFNYPHLFSFDQRLADSPRSCALLC